MCARPVEALAGPSKLEASPIVAAEVLAVAVTAAAELAEVVHEPLIQAGVYPVKVI